VSAPRKLTATALTTLSLTLLAAAGPLSAAASPSSAAARALAQRACTKSPAGAARRGRQLAHPCGSHAGSRKPKARKPKPAASHPVRHSRTRASRPAGAPAATPAEPAVTGATSTTPTAQASADEHAATIAAVLSTPCENTELTPEAGNIEVVRAAVLCLINRKRAENGEDPLKTSPQLEQAAEGHCQELIADDYFAHVSPSGETPVERIRDTGYIPNSNVGYVIGENLAWGTYQLSTPQAIVAAWIASPGHLANILESHYLETGIGIVSAVPASLAPDAPGATYAQEFGVIIQ